MYNQAPQESGSEPAVARIKIGMGDVDGGLAALDKAANSHDPFFQSEPLTSPTFNRVKNDPRFAAIARKVGLPI